MQNIFLNSDIMLRESGDKRLPHKQFVDKNLPKHVMTDSTLRSQYYLRVADHYMGQKPLVSFGYLLERLSEGARINTNKFNNDILCCFLDACEIEIPKDEIKWDNIFSTTNYRAINNIELAGTMMIEVLYRNAQDYLECPNFNVKAVKYIEENLHQFAKRAKMHEKKMTYEKIQSIIGYEQNIESNFSSLSESLRDTIRQTPQSLHHFFGLLKEDRSTELSFNGSNDFPKNIFGHLKEFERYIDEGKSVDAIRVSKKIQNYLLICFSADSISFRAFVLPIFSTIISISEGELVSRNQPAALNLEQYNTKYPFFDIDAQITLRLLIGNTGEGYGHNVEIEMKFPDEAQVMPSLLSEYSDIWQMFAPGTRLLEIPIKLKKPFATELICDVSITWTNTDSTVEETNELVSFECETKRIDWETFKNSPKYSIEPVRSEEEFFGRESRIDPLYNDIVVHGSSYWLYGQKRIGKTSTMLGVYRQLSVHDNFCVAHVAYGDFSHQDPIITVNQLVQNISKKIKRSSGLDIDLPETNGSLSPLISFFEDIHEETGKKIYFMIDEIDELPYTFYERNDASQPFWQTLRSISLKSYSGFMLVGGENVHLLKDQWGGSLNLLRTYNASKFDLHENKEYQQLVITPVKDELELPQNSIQLLYNETFGNPYYTKILCGDIQRYASRTHTATISEYEISKVISQSIHGDGGLTINNFQHFIEDGIKGEEDYVTQKRSERATLLLTLAQELQNKDTLVVSILKSKCRALGISEDHFNDLMNEFVMRDILKQDHETVDLRMPLFKKYLRYKGVYELPRFTATEREYERYQSEKKKYQIPDAQMRDLIENWGGVYQGKRIEPEQVLEWLSQFRGLHNQFSVFHLLKKIKFVTKSDLSTQMRNAFSLVTKELVHRKTKQSSYRDDIYVSYLDGAGKSGGWLANQFKEFNQVLKKNIVSPSKIESMAEKSSVEAKAILFVDDFACTGNSLSDYIKEHSFLLNKLSNELDVQVMIYVTYGFESAREHILRIIRRETPSVELHFGEILDSKEQLFSTDSRYFDDENQKSDMQELLIEQYGKKVDARIPAGYEKSEVAIVFPDNCPNNSLPIFWKNRDSREFTWRALFPRIIM